MAMESSWSGDPYSFLRIESIGITATDAGL